MPGEMKNLYLICGDEEYLKLEKKNELLKRFDVEGSLNFNEFRGREQDINEIRVLSETMPFMQDHRVILLEETGWFKGASGEEAPELLSSLCASTVMIFVENETDAANKLYKLIRDRGEIYKFVKTESLSYKEAEAQQARIRDSVKKMLQKEERSISSRSLNRLLGLTGYDLFNVKNELEKLITYTYGREAGAEITDGDIDAICSKNISEKVFDMLSAKLEGNTVRALMLFEEMLSIKTAPMKVLVMLEKQFNQVYMLKELLASGAAEAEAASKMDIQPWLARRLREQSSRLRMSDARRYLERAVELETAVKSGDISDRLAVEILLTE